jgi:hypothetical protein
VSIARTSRVDAIGNAVIVLVDPSNLEHVSVAGETNQSAWTTIPMIFALVLGAAGLAVCPVAAPGASPAKGAFERAVAARRVPLPRDPNSELGAGAGSVIGH